jgi:hypothetical protein
MKLKDALTVPLLLCLLAIPVLAADPSIQYIEQILIYGGGPGGQRSVVDIMTTIGMPIALIMLIYMGIKWSMAESPEEHENAKKGIIYIVIGVILIRVGVGLAYYLLDF